MEALIGKLDIENAFKIFIAMQPDTLNLSYTESHENGLSEEHCYLLQYIRSSKSSKMSKFMNSAMESAS